MRFVHVVPHVSAEASGPSYSVPRLCQALAGLGHEVELSCLGAGRKVEGVTIDEHKQWPVLGRFAPSSSHPRALRKKAGEVDVIHNHGLWSMVNVATGWVVPGRGAKLVVSPRGTLSEWALNRSSTAKRALWPLQRRALAKADMLHATSEDEYADIRRLGLSAPVLLSPNAVDVPDRLPDSDGSRKERTLLFLSRLHPKKGVDRLLHSWASLERRYPGWQLRIVGIGPSEYEEELTSLSRKLGLRRAAFVGPLYGEDKAEAYTNADLFVLPTHSENFGLAVAEALAHGVPVIVSKGAPWSRVESQGCGWWVDNDVESLTHALGAAMSLPAEDRLAMGLRGREWMGEEFSWDSVARDMERAYRWLLDGGGLPSCVRVD
ncbi:glycosyltransferase [Arhodomonas sp. SL1]|uniref:glycosyltransferase n=1 Tax=Arhodomonas sp. SL1 TaxID=3425691 RepID=UPI003F8839D1